MQVASPSYLFQCENLQDQMNEYGDQLKKECKKVKEGDELYESCQLINSMKSIHCIDNDQLDDELQKISTSSALLYIQFAEDKEFNFDFNKLSSSKDVIIVRLSSSRQFSKSYVTMNDVSNAIHQILKVDIPIEKMNQQYKHKKADQTNIKFVGNFGNKVPSLSLFGENEVISITEDEITNENLYLKGCDIDENSKNIRSKKLIVDGDTHVNILNHANKDLIKVEQYGIDLIEDNDNTEFQIELNNDKFTLKKKDANGGWVDFVQNNYNIVEHSMSKSFCLLSFSQHIDINVPSKEVTSVGNVNISAINIYHIDIPLSTLLDTDEKSTLRITKSGEWGGIPKENYPKISVMADENMFDLDIDEEFDNSGINVDQEKPFKYPEAPEKKGKNIGLIVGVTVACVVVVAVVIVVVVIVIKKKKNQNKSLSEGEQNNQNDEE